MANEKLFKTSSGGDLYDESMGRLDEIVAYADKHGLRKNLDDVLNRLVSWQGSQLPFYEGKELRTTVYSDFAPLSLFFVRSINGQSNLVGGVIFHGQHDNGGDGGSPTFSVSLNNDTNPHWEIHT